MKIIDVETIYLRQPDVKSQCDSGQDALIVKVITDAGITGVGEVDSSPLAAKGAIDGPFSHNITSGLKHIVIGEDPFETEYLWHKMYRANIYAGRRGIGIHAMSGLTSHFGISRERPLANLAGSCSAGAFTKSSDATLALCSARLRKRPTSSRAGFEIRASAQSSSVGIRWDKTQNRMLTSFGKAGEELERMAIS
jgi:hypothetical protein